MEKHPILGVCAQPMKLHPIFRHFQHPMKGTPGMKVNSFDYIISLTPSTTQFHFVKFTEYVLFQLHQLHQLLNFML